MTVIATGSPMPTPFAMLWLLDGGEDVEDEVDPEVVDEAGPVTKEVIFEVGAAVDEVRLAVESVVIVELAGAGKVDVVVAAAHLQMSMNLEETSRAVIGPQTPL